MCTRQCAVSVARYLDLNDIKSTQRYTMGDLLDYALDLMRRLPPAQVEDNLAGLIDICPDIIEDLLSSVDQPLKIGSDRVEGRDYLLCDYNRDGDSYRSPWSNTYDPEPEYDDANFPSTETRALEVKVNKAFNTYRDLYFEGGVSSCYLWDTDGPGFAGCILIKKSQDQTRGGQPMKGTWDSIHVFQIDEISSSRAEYNLTSTVMLSIETETPETGTVRLAGSLTRQEVQEEAFSDHIANLGSMVEQMVNRLRTTIDTIYFGKTKDIVSFLRKKMGGAMKNNAMQNELFAALAGRRN